jgi:small subunit ribosomal protein S18
MDTASKNNHSESTETTKKNTKRRIVFRRKRVCPFMVDNAPEITFKDIKLLQKYISERGRIIPRRITGVSSKAQRSLSQAIKHARVLALLPYEIK